MSPVLIPTQPGGGKRANSLKLHVAELKQAFGENAVFLPCQKKGCHWRGWQKLTRRDMNEAYILKVNAAPQIGVLCGDNSGGLVCIDLDEEAAMLRFANAIPEGMRPTSVVGRPGRVKFFFRLPEGEAGKKRKLVSNGVDVGDWLANGSQAIVAGAHHEAGTPYRIADFTQPAWVTRVQLCNLLSTAGISVGNSDPAPSPKCDVEYSNKEQRKNIYLLSYHSASESLGIDEIEQRNAIVQRAEERLAKQPRDIQRVYEEQVGRWWKAAPGERNMFIVQAVPFLIRRVAPGVLLELVSLGYELYAELFEDPRERHLHEAKEHLRNCLSTYSCALPPREQRMYGNADEWAQALFRIGRDLARCNGVPQKAEFFLSCHQLAVRLGGLDQQAWRELQKAEQRGWITMVKKGTQRQAGIAGKPTVWRWNLSLEPWPDTQLAVGMANEFGSVAGTA